MNKKLLYGIMLPLFAIILVSAGIITYYGQIQQELNVESPIEVLSNPIVISGYAGQIIEGEPITITNNADFDVEIGISNNAEVGVDVSYIGTLELTKKDTSTWEATGDSIEITYTVVGDTFEFSEIPEGYTLIYYKDEVVGLEGRFANPQPAIIISGENLPHEDDANIDELANYCAEPDFYNQCKGAKLWIVLTSDIDDGNLAWGNWDSFYFETDLIQYNAEGKIIMSGNSNMIITPVYKIASSYVGNSIITTSINPIA